MLTAFYVFALGVFIGGAIEGTTDGCGGSIVLSILVAIGTILVHFGMSLN